MLAVIMTLAMSTAVFAVSDVMGTVPQQVYSHLDEAESFDSITYGDNQCLICPIVMDAPGIIWTDLNDDETSVALYTELPRNEDNLVPCLRSKDPEDNYYDQTRGNGGYYVQSGTYYLAINDSLAAGKTISGRVRIVYNKTSAQPVSNFTLLTSGITVTMKFKPTRSGAYFVGGSEARVLNSKNATISDTKYGSKRYFGLKKGVTYYIRYAKATGTKVKIMNVGAKKLDIYNKYAASLRTAKSLPAIRMLVNTTGDDDDYDIYANAQSYIGDTGSRYVKIYVPGKHKVFFKVDSGLFNGREYVQIVNGRGTAMTAKYYTGTSKKVTLSKGTYYVKFTKKYASDSGKHSIMLFMQ